MTVLNSASPLLLTILLSNRQRLCSKKRLFGQSKFSVVYVSQCSLVSSIISFPLFVCCYCKVTLSGSVHSLQPLSYVFNPGQILLISEPVVCMGALWVPYRRDPKMMKAILTAGNFMNSNNDVESVGSRSENIDLNTIGGEIVKENVKLKEKISIIFCHADIQGASMNDGMRCREGLDISAFPPNLPIYSGHFHKPHTVSTSIIKVYVQGLSLVIGNFSFFHFILYLFLFFMFILFPDEKRKIES